MTGAEVGNHTGKVFADEAMITAFHVAWGNHGGEQFWAKFVGREESTGSDDGRPTSRPSSLSVLFRQARPESR